MDNCMDKKFGASSSADEDAELGKSRRFFEVHTTGVCDHTNASMTIKNNLGAKSKEEQLTGVTRVEEESLEAFRSLLE